MTRKEATNENRDFAKIARVEFDCLASQYWPDNGQKGLIYL
jgi:hypothetical protein